MSATFIYTDSEICGTIQYSTGGSIASVGCYIRAWLSYELTASTQTSVTYQIKWGREIRATQNKHVTNTSNVTIKLTGTDNVNGSNTDNAGSIGASSTSWTRSTLGTINKTYNKSTTSLTKKLQIALKVSGNTGVGNTEYVNLTIPALALYTITYDSNGGTPTPSSQTCYAGSNIVVSGAKPIRNNCNFVGWLPGSKKNPDDSYSGNLISASSSYSPTNNITLYAYYNWIYYPPTLNNIKLTRINSNEQYSDMGEYIKISCGWEISKIKYDTNKLVSIMCSVQENNQAITSLTDLTLKATDNVNVNGDISYSITNYSFDLTKTYTFIFTITDYQTGSSPTAGTIKTYNIKLAPPMFPLDISANGSAIGLLKEAPDNATGVYLGDNLYIGNGTMNNLFIQMAGTSFTDKVLRVQDNGDGAGLHLAVGGSGTTLIGSGESIDRIITTPINNEFVSTTEALSLASDSNIYFYSNCQQQNTIQAMTYNSSGQLTIPNKLTVSTGGIGVTGAATFSSTLTTNGKLTVSSGGAAISGTTTITGALTATSYTVSGHSTAIGSILTVSKSQSKSSSSDFSNITDCYLSIPIGAWVITYSCYCDVNVADKRLGAVLYNSSTGNDYESTRCISHTSNTAATAVTGVFVGNFTAAQTIYLRAFQTSGDPRTVYGYLRAVRIA